MCGPLFQGGHSACCPSRLSYYLVMKKTSQEIRSRVYNILRSCFTSSYHAQHPKASNKLPPQLPFRLAHKNTKISHNVKPEIYRYMLYILHTEQEQEQEQDDNTTSVTARGKKCYRRLETFLNVFSRRK